jgi:hypothetical protein
VATGRTGGGPIGSGVSRAWWAAQGKNGEGKRWAGRWAGASELCCEGGLRGGGKARKERGKLGREERIGPTGLDFLFSISNSFLIPRFESNLNRIQNRTKFYSNLKLKHSFKSKQNESSVKCNKQIFIKPKLI